MRTHTLFALLVAVILLAAARPAEARAVHFVGPHPVAARYGGGYCYIESPHMHIYAPDRPALYQQVGDEYVFTGDPTPFGYDGERHRFYGHHPVVSVNGEPVYCYLDGPHYHEYPPPATPEYKIKNGVAFYVGPFAPAYVKLKPHRVKQINAEYRPYVQFRPVVEVEPPPEWHGEVYVAAPVPSIEVRAPGVYVAPPRPHVQVEVSAPGIYVAPPQPHIYVSPPPHVVIDAPAPHVVVGAPGAVFVGPPGVRVEERGHWHHDNGKHKGWYKH